MSLSRPGSGRRRIPGLLRSIGPELLSSASGNDPTNVGTRRGRRRGQRLPAGLGGAPDRAPARNCANDCTPATGNPLRLTGPA
jgi:hypothetical protein